MKKYFYLTNWEIVLVQKMWLRVIRAARGSASLHVAPEALALAFHGKELPEGTAANRATV